MATDFDVTTYNGGVRATILCCRSEEELDKPTSWHRTYDLCIGSCPILRWLVGPSKGKEKTDDIPFVKGHGELFGPLYPGGRADYFSFTIGLGALSRSSVLRRYPLD